MAGFKKFLLRGNVLDLAVAVVMGVAFNAIVQSLISSLISPLIAMLAGKVSVAQLAFTMNGTTFPYGKFLNALISFLTIAAVVYFLLVAPVAKLTTIATKHKAASERNCPECLSSIPVAATRCKYCTATVTPVPAPAQVTTAPVIKRMLGRHSGAHADPAN